MIYTSTTVSKPRQGQFYVPTFATSVEDWGAAQHQTRTLDAAVWLCRRGRRICPAYVRQLQDAHLFTHIESESPRKC